MHSAFSDPEERLRVTHLLTGDGIGTNEAAAQRLLMHYHSQRGVDYALLMWSCASHQSNLVCHLAVCGEITRDPVNNNALCGCASRLFKHLLPAYFEEFSLGLGEYLTECCEQVETTPELQLAHHTHIEGLEALYGPYLFPDEIKALYNTTLARPVHAATVPQDHWNVTSSESLTCERLDFDELPCNAGKL